jgi:hypothetical protein
MTAEGIQLCYCGYWGRGILHDDVITQLYTPPTQTSLIPDNSDVTSTIRKGQGSDCAESTRIVMQCIQFLTFFNIFEAYNLRKILHRIVVYPTKI